MADDN